MQGWGEGSSAVASTVERETSQCLAAYEAKANLVEQDAGIEISNVEGGYGRKQLNELLQNAADAMVTEPGRVAVVLNEHALYCANQGEPLTVVGVEALMASHLSRKRDEQIGRFGLGFKSVLGISDAPEVLSRSGCIRFDRQAAARLIRKVVPDAGRTPVLRVAETVDFGEVSAADPIVEELSWATTIVRLPRVADTDWLTQELGRFPAEFLLFARHVRQLEIDDRTVGDRRVWQVRRDRHRVSLESDGRSVGWRVFTRKHRPSAAASSDAGEIAGRQYVEVAWAVPDQGRAAAGRFWAYFPTNSRTTLSGIVNTAFKTTEDRHDILDGAFNREILECVLPALVSESLEDLVDGDDPCSLLEILPARGREVRSWADDSLNDPVMRAVAAVPCVPDVAGRLRRVSEVGLAPAFLAEHRRWTQLWASAADGPVDWVHPSVDESTERRAKLTRLFQLGGGRVAATDAWLQAIAAAGVAGSQVATQLADQIFEREADELLAVRRARIVLTADGTLRPPIVGKLFLPDLDGHPASAEFVHQALVDDPDTAFALQRLGIGPLDALGRLNGQIATVKTRRRVPDVERLWVLARRLPPESAVRALEAGFGRGETPVRTVDARPAGVGRCLLPGTVVPSNGSRDAALTIDSTFHATDHEVLARLGAVDGPRLHNRLPDEPWCEQWTQHVRDVYVAEAHARGLRVPYASVNVKAGRTVSHLNLLPELSPEGRVAMTREAIGHAREPWQAYAEARTSIGPITVLNPALWWLRRHGLVATAWGPMSPADVVAPLEGVAADLLPVPVGLVAADIDALGVGRSVDADWWTQYLIHASSLFDIAKLHRLYAAAARNGCPRPSRLVADIHGGTVDPDDVVVTADPATARTLRDVIDVVLVDSEPDLDVLRSRWGLADAASRLTRHVLHAPAGDAVPVVDRFPGLRVTAPALSASVVLQACTDLAVQIIAIDAGEGTTESVEAIVDTDTLYVLDGKSDVELLTVVDELLRLRMDARRREQTLEIGRRQETGAVTRAVRSATTPEEKLLLLAGAEEIRKAVPAEAVQIASTRAGRPLRDLEIAKMAGTGMGTELLRRLAPAIEKRGIVVPRRLNGGSTAASFVEDLGLPAIFAGSQENARPASESVLGPVHLPALHRYQALCVDRIAGVLSGAGPSRGLVALPTGSGKTRVAVEAVVDHIRTATPDALIVWIAQTDELCEQAVETWSYVWRAVGSHETRLTVNRLWGGNDATRIEQGAQVVVATDDKLLSVSQRGRHDWLTEADVVIVDEAHTSVSKTYTTLFNWLGRGTRQRRHPLLGLSATPYRGNNEDQTRQLINRYDGNLLTDELFGDTDPHAYLQDLGILARVRHEVLVGMRLTPMAGRPDQRLETEQIGLLESRIDLAKVAADEDRNERIIDSLLALDEDVTAIVFAASVQHAETLAAVLEHEAVPAAAVSSFTGSGERRERIRRFQQGRIRVLTNYNVLSQGFDAPRVGAVYVARPTFSPNRYQQMIGRGLRGPLNGGSEEVLIVNVQDNIDAFGEKLAFHHFDEMWRVG